MGKKRKNRSSVVASGESSADNSNKGTPVGSDVEASETATPPAKKQKQETEKRPDGQKSSADLCKDFRLKDVQLKYTEADYLNLTNYGLFVRMVRPQVQQANPGIDSGMMSKLMEAKWREFREANPLTKKRVELENKKKEGDTKKKEQEEIEKAETSKQSREKSRKSYAEENSDDSDEELLTKRTPRSRSKKKQEDSDDEEVIPQRKSRSSRGRGTTAMEALDSDTEEEQLPKKRSGRSSTSPRPSAPQSMDSDSDSETEVEEDDEEDDYGKKKKKRGGLVLKLSALGKSKKGKQKSKPATSDSDSKDDVSDDSDDDRTPSRGRKSASKPKYVDSSDEDSGPRARRKKGKKKQKESSEDDYGGEDETLSDDDFINDDDDDEEFGGERRRRSRKRAKTPPKRPVIPGERKSARKKGGNVSYDLQSDRDFEKMLAEDARKVREEEKKKAKKKAKKMEIVGKRGMWQDDKKIDSGEESDHCWYCEICKDGGDLLLCDSCPKSFHQACLALKEGDIPEGDWNCPVCKGEELPEHIPEEEDFHDQYCHVCRDGGDVLLCDFCPLVFHKECVNPPLEEVPTDDWKCPVCKMRDNPLKNKVQKVLTWKWSHQLKGQDVMDHTMSPEKRKRLESQGDSKEKREQRPVRELFVKYQDWSFWDCEWIPELQLEIHQQTTHTIFKKKFDMNEPPALEDGSSFGRVRHRGKGAKEDDPYQLEEKYYRYGIKPEWLQVHRVFNDDGNKGKLARYLVKWKDLPYEEATWEDPNDLPDGLVDFQKHVDIYIRRKKDRDSSTKDKKPPKKTVMKKKWDEDPPYVKATGGKLHDYQLEGVNWIRFSYAQDTNVILADEMGLGKTVQAITFLYSLWKDGYTKGPFLVSAPLSTVPNWEREFEFWAPDMYVVTYTGGRENRAIIREHEFSYKEGAFPSYTRPMRMRQSHKVKFDVILTNYEIVNVDSTTLNSIDWAVLVVDEAHRLKSQQSLFFRTLSDYSIEYRLLLTGTPLQNNLEELFNLLNFLERGKFSDLEEFLGQFSDISKDEQVSQLHNLLGPHMLRRLKIDVLKDMPSKAEFLVRVDLAPMQKTFYKYILTKNFSALNVKGSSHQTTLMNIMMDLRKCCNHPYLFPSAEQEAPINKNGMFEVTAMTKACGKLDLLSKMLKVLKRQNHRVLIFSQMTRVLDLLEDFLVGEDTKYERIDGSISGKYRQEAIDRFNCVDSKVFVFLLSTKAGGLGINLATADTVIIYDQDWNPHNDIQAFSRAHRIGQKNKVMIFRFVSRNTVEERITQVAKGKMALTELIIHRGMASVEKTESLSKQEVNDILKFGAEDLFKDDEEGKVVWDKDSVEKLLDRSQVGDNNPDDVDDEKAGMNEYLRSFKVAKYQVKETTEEEEVEEEEPKQEEPTVNDDPEYWQRILGDAYQEHQAAIMQEQERIAASLGKGKRVRRQVNYAEAEKGIQNVKLSKKSSPDDEDYEPAVKDGNYSDYAPSSEESEAESDGDEAKAGTSDEEFNPAVAQQRLRKGIPEAKFEQKTIMKSRELPPLLRNVESHVEVLGFTPRQRKAFLDAIMRYGMPIEDSYKSQWLVRDLRNKPEKVFKAYVAMFMRHLCEPTPEEAEQFADGVPREGLSRQHVLTRIGMMSLIRRKVQEFEKQNGTLSMKDFAHIVEKKKAEEEVRVQEEAKRKALLLQQQQQRAQQQLQQQQQQSVVVQVQPAVPISGNIKPGTTVPVLLVNTSPKATKSDSVKIVVNKKEGDAKDGDETKDNPGDETKENTGDSKTEEDVKDDDNKDEDNRDSSAVEGASSASSTRPSSVVSVDRSDEDSKDSTSSKESKDSDVEEIGGQVDGANDDKDEEKKDDKSDVNEEEGAESEPEDSKPKESENAEEEKPKKESGETVASEVKDEIPEEKVEATEEKSEDKTEAKEKKSDEEEVVNESTDSGEESEDEDPDAKRKRQMRRLFYIADGGFTNLHALWQYEENLLKDDHIHEMWHRLHDYWLLCGIVTHGYRHWQDILNDPRFEILNQAFQRETDKMKKGAFLNRRFQLLEQSLVIEEQMSKSLRAHGTFEGLPTLPGNRDSFSEIDELALALRKIANNGIEGTLKKYEKQLSALMTQLESLVGDIQQATYSMMPATLARAPATQSKPQAQQFRTKPVVARPSQGKQNTVASLVGYRPQGGSPPTTVRHQLAQRDKEKKDVITLD